MSSLTPRESWQYAAESEGLRGPWAQRLADELAAHHEDLVDAAMARGYSRQRATRFARSELGDPKTVMRIAREKGLGQLTWLQAATSVGIVAICSRWLFAAFGGAVITASLLLTLTLTIYAGA